MDFSFAYNPSRQPIVAGEDAPAVLSSEIWGDEKGTAELIDIAEERLPIRVQISVGAELQKYENRLQAFLDLGGACDLLFDRPLTKDLQQKLLPLTVGFNFRLCLVVSRFFDVHTVIDSLAPELRKHLFLLFLPPESKSSCYLSNDEVVRVLNTLDSEQEWNALILSNVVEHCASIQDRHFFASLDTDTYYAGSKLLKDYSFFRTTVGWLARRKFVFLLDFIYSLIVFLKNPQNFVRYRTWASLKQLPQFIRYRTQIGFSFVRYSIVPPLRNFVQYQVLHRLIVFCRYTAIPWLQIFMRHRVPWLLGIIFYPVLKIYWFASYQFENRLLPLLKRESKDP